MVIHVVVDTQSGYEISPSRQYVEAANLSGIKERKHFIFWRYISISTQIDTIDERQTDLFFI